MYLGDLKRQAESGNANAQYELGMFYLDGDGIKNNINIEGFLKWISVAASKGHAKALYQLGLHYKENSDHEKAYHNFLLAAKKNLPDAMYEVAIYAISDSKIEYAKNILRLASKCGHSKSQYQLALILIDEYWKLGDVTSSRQVHDEYIKMLKLASDQGHKGAMYELGVNYINDFNFNYEEDQKRVGYGIMLKLSYEGNADATLNLAFCYENGVGTEKNKKMAEKFYLQVINKLKQSRHSRTLYSAYDGYFRVCPLYKRLFASVPTWYYQEKNIKKRL